MAHFLLFVVHFSCCDVRSETFLVIEGAHDTIDDGHQDKDDGEDGEGGEFLARSKVVLLTLGGVHANELEYKVCQPSEVEDQNRKGAEQPLPSAEECCGKKDDDGDGNSGDCEGELALSLRDDYNELDGEAEEKEEIELEEGNVDLEGEVSFLHA